MRWVWKYRETNHQYFMFKLGILNADYNVLENGENTHWNEYYTCMDELQKLQIETTFVYCNVKISCIPLNIL